MKIISLLGEASTENKAPLPIDKDLLYRARNKYPQYSGEQALTLYIADEMASKEKTDNEQDRLINAQRQQNKKLTDVIDSLGSELNNFERQSQETDREVERLKQLSGKVTQGGAETQRKAKVSSDELEKLSKDMQQLKAKPGIDSEKVKQLEKQIKQIASNPSMDDAEVKRIQNIINTLQQKQVVGDELYNKAFSELVSTQKELDAKEERFKDYIATTGREVRTSSDEIKQYADIVSGYKQDIKNFDNFMKQEKNTMLDLRASVQQDAEEINKIVNIMKDVYNTAKDKSAEPVQPQVPAQKFQDIEQNPQLNRGRFVDITTESVQLAEQQPTIYKDWNDPEFNAWMERNISVLLKLFKSSYKVALERKKATYGSTYGDGQIAYELQEEAWYLKRIFDSNDPIITKEKMDSYLAIVKMALFKQPVELSHQEELPLSESLDNTYSRMLDKIIGLPYI